MNDNIRSTLESLHPERCSAVEISGDFHLQLPWQHYESLRFPEFDLCDPVPGRHYDVVICEQVLEHVADPWRASRTMAGMCSPGGHVVVSTPFLVRIHPEPDDLWRFTAHGLRRLLEEAGLEVRSISTWGNASCVRANLRAWVPYRPWNSLRNDPLLPVVVWALARRHA